MKPRLKPMTREEREAALEAASAEMVAAIELVGAQPNEDGWFTMWQFCTPVVVKVSVTAIGHVVVVGSRTVDVNEVFLFEPQADRLALLRRMASMQPDVLGFHCLTCEDDWRPEVAISDLDGFIADHYYAKKSARLLRIRDKLSDGCMRSDVSRELDALELDEDEPGKCVNERIITARAIVRRIVELLEAAP